MWYATKIELKQNKEKLIGETQLDDWYTLYINDETISNSIGRPKEFQFSYVFQAYVCTFCGQEGCNSGQMLMLRKQGAKIFVLPAFNEMVLFSEYIPGTGEGDRECPPHTWFTKGILVIEGELLNEFYKLFPAITEQSISEISDMEIAQMNVWEDLVNRQPPGFTHTGNKKRYSNKKIQL